MTDALLGTEQNAMVVKMHVEETQDERLGGPQKCGRKFVEYWKNNGCTDGDGKVDANAVAKQMPDVDIKYKVKRLSDFDSKTGQCFVNVLLMLDWEDKSLAIAENQDSPDFHEHFWPKAEMQGLCPGEGPPDVDAISPKYKRDKGNKKGFGEYRATLTIQFQNVLYARVDFREYPFDHQTLEITVKLLSVRVPGCSKGTRPTARHPTRWRGVSDKKEGGHTLVKDCDCLPEYDFVRLCSRAYSSAYGPFIGDADKKTYEKDKDNNKLYQDEYTLQIIMVRDSVSVMWNMCFSLFVIDVMVFSAHGIAMDELGDRLGVNLTLLLTAMAFKWVLSDSLPPVPYLTTMEKYVICTFACLWLQGLAFWILAEFSVYRCGDKLDYWTGESILDANRTVTMDITCTALQQIDRSVLFIEVAALIVKNVWFIYRVCINRVENIKKETNYINLGGLDEFSMQADMKFVGKDEMNGIKASGFPPAKTSSGKAVSGAKVGPESA